MCAHHIFNGKRLDARANCFFFNLNQFFVAPHQTANSSLVVVLPFVYFKCLYNTFNKEEEEEEEVGDGVPFVADKITTNKYLSLGYWGYDKERVRRVQLQTNNNKLDWKIKKLKYQKCATFLWMRFIWFPTNWNIEYYILSLADLCTKMLLDRYVYSNS